MVKGTEDVVEGFDGNVRQLRIHTSSRLLSHPYPLFNDVTTNSEIKVKHFTKKSVYDESQ